IKWLTIAAVAAALVAVGLLIIPFPSHIDQQHISPRSGPGYTWMGDYPPSNPDPFSLEHLRPPVSPDETIRDGEQPGRITHTLDFELDSSHSSENGMNGKETERR
ncbi:hypothetical protein JXA80_09500, partial [bacterium]|nr:hypothetical protein [candidate division CSSED10-310 bacterium]